MAESAPASRAARAFSSDETAATTRAPKAFPISTDAIPIPPAAPRTRSVSCLKPAAIDQRMDGGCIGKEQGRALLEAAFRRQRNRAFGRDDQLLGQPAIAEG